MQERVYWFNAGIPLKIDCPDLKIDQPDKTYRVMTIRRNDRIIAREFLFDLPPKELQLPKAHIKWKMLMDNRLELISDKFAYGVFIDLPEGIEADDNFFHLMPGEKKIVRLTSDKKTFALNQIKIKSLADTY